MSARIIFAGTPDFAVPALESLVAAGYPPLQVYTQPDRRAGRGRKLKPPPVKVAADKHAIPVKQPERLDAEEAAAIAAQQPDLMVVVAYGQILPAAVLEAPRCGCVNIHASLLPRWRGAAPVQRALMAGDKQTGITLIRMDEGLDTGAMFARESTPIGPEDTGGSLHDRLADLGARLLVEHLPAILEGSISAVAQPADGVTYAAKLGSADYWLDWSRPAVELERQVRALYPLPGARTRLGKRDVRVQEAHHSSGVAGDEPGRVVDISSRGIAIATAAGRLVITRLKPAGGREQAVAAYLNGNDLGLGELAG
ncbi:methionyl-tRNA formyltransferase [Halorhodospira halochloris]|uniref:Methionyl-tRNA formyltransferase n=1 Tax=Halorhodospira halochloris TaxID=1052 RepID=A0A0X8X713_HALHR|nr:methionyl-tRNA formyltransferase [Halorhodospira halochloris]MBK1650699.1 methionyl-tRNA formyltransferase [Halorhodospira halochloris]BAU56812.1 methionyl-tRNA formyltransferase [Halorhodospira halochloris]